MATSAVSSGGLFWTLDDFLLLNVALFLDEPSVGAVLRSCKLWYDLEQKHRRAFWRSRLYNEYGALRLPDSPRYSKRRYTQQDGHGNAWKVFAEMLYSGRRDYKGAAMDAHTHHFKPYSMQLNLNTVFPTDDFPFDGMAWIIWRDLNNAITRVSLPKMERSSHGSKRITAIPFSEVELVSGEDILIPNHYFGYCYGPALIGIYPNGAFWLMVKEATPLEGNYESSTHDTNRTDLGDHDIASCCTLLAPGLQFSGIVTMEQNPFDMFQLERYPQPVSTVLELELGAKISTLEGPLILAENHDGGDISCDLNDAGFFGVLKLRVKEPDGNTGNYGYSVAVIKVNHDNRNDYNLVIFVTSKAVPFPGDSALSEKKLLQAALTDAARDRHSVNAWEADFLSGSKFFAWQRGNCILGVLQNKKLQAGAFCLQHQRDENDLIYPALKQSVEQHRKS